MADKQKRLRKILDRKRMRGKLKLVDSLEEASSVLLDDRRYDATFKLLWKDSYLEMLEEGHTVPEENVYFVVPTNPRDKFNIEKRLLTSSFANMINKFR